MAIVKASPATLVLDRKQWKRECVRTATQMGVFYAGSMTLWVGIITMLSGASLGHLVLLPLACALAGACFGLGMLPCLLVVTRPVQHVLPVASTQDGDVMLSALHATLLKLKFRVIGEDEDYRHYHFTRRFVIKLIHVRLLIFADRLVVLGPAGPVQNVLRKSKLWKRRKR